MNPHCRIGKIRLKSGGASLRVFTSKRTLESEQTRADFLLKANQCADAMHGKMAGYAILVLGCDGAESGVHFISVDAHTTTAELPEYLRASFRRRISRTDTAQIIQQTFGG